MATGRKTESPGALAIRQREALVELGLAKDYEHVVCNRDVDETAREILGKIEAVREQRRSPA
jgi:guanylate kinase